MDEQYSARSKHEFDPYSYQDNVTDDAEYQIPTTRKNDYYKILGISKSATLQEIKAAFRKLSRESHPDIQVQNSLNLPTSSLSEQEAQERLKRYFELKQAKITEAYDVLSDPRKKIQYDTFGKVVLDLEKYQGQDADEIHEQVKQEERSKAFKALQKEANASSRAELKIDAVNLINSMTRDSNDEDEEDQQKVLVHAVNASISQNYEIKVGDYNVFRFIGRALYDVEKKKNAFTFAVTHGTAIRPKTEQTSLDTTFIFQNNQSSNLNINSNYRTKLNKYSSASAGLTLQLRPEYSEEFFKVLSCNAEYSRILFNDPTFHGSINVDLPQGCTFTAIKQYENTKITSQIKTGRDVDVSVDVTRNLKMIENSKLIVNASTNTSLRHDLSVLLSRRVASQTELGIGVGVGEEGLSIRCSIKTQKHYFNVPITLSNNASNLKALLFGVFAPSVLFFTFRQLVYNPLQTKWNAEKLLEKRRENYNSTKTERERAVQQKEQMRDGILKSRAQEEKVKGLLIINARYGNLKPDDESTTLQEHLPYFDVTDQLQFQVQNSRLYLPPVSKSMLDGFYDPCPEEEKSLLVIYRFLGDTHRVQIDDEDALEIPSENDKTHAAGEQQGDDHQYEYEDDDE
ncbi:Dnaj [Acrasis kona]|uniref:Dnaj n=1 Tax=Acrasis kona TaxID=1008807 RepID=A0AAW2Z6U3_9EUKA